jgi:outer membrane protein TolC
MNSPLWVIKLGASFTLLLVATLPANAQGASPLSIEKAEELARGKADQVVAKRAAAEAALRNVDVAQANLLPKLSGGVSGSYIVNPYKGTEVYEGSLGSLPYYNIKTGTYNYIPMPDSDLYIGGVEDTYFKGDLTFSQPLIAWGKIRASMDIAASEAEVSEIEAEGAALDAARQANRAYFSALLSRRSASILAELRDLAGQIVKDRTSALDEGLATKEDILSSKADLADLESRLVEAQEGERSALEALALLTGLEVDSIELLSDFRSSPPQTSENELKDSSLGSSTSFKEARARLAEAERRLDLARDSSLFKPDVTFFTSFEFSGQDVPYSSDSWTNTWNWDISIGLSATADFFDGGASTAREKEARAGVDAARAALSAAGKSARLEVRKAIEEARRAQAALAASSTRREWAAEALHNARTKIADQLISRSELNAAAIREASARLDELDAQYRLEEATADLDRLSGGRAR